MDQGTPAEIPEMSANCMGIVFLPAGTSISLTSVVLPELIAELITELHFLFPGEAKKRREEERSEASCVSWQVNSAKGA